MSSSCSRRSITLRTSVAWFSGSSLGTVQTYSCSAESGARPRASSASCSRPKSAKAQRITSWGSPFSPALSPISSSPWSMRYSSRSSWSIPAGFRRNTPILRNRKLTLPVVARLPPPLVTMLRTAATVRVGLSVAVSTSRDRKSTRLNSSHSQISYAVFCLKKKKKKKKKKKNKKKKKKKKKRKKKRIKKKEKKKFYITSFITKKIFKRGF